MGVEDIWIYYRDEPNYFHKKGCWKYCRTTTLTPHTGSDEGHNQMGLNYILVHTLVFYFNTYGLWMGAIYI